MKRKTKESILYVSLGCAMILASCSGWALYFVANA